MNKYLRGTFSTSTNFEYRISFYVERIAQLKKNTRGKKGSDFQARDE